MKKIIFAFWLLLAVILHSEPDYGKYAKFRDVAPEGYRELNREEWTIKHPIDNSNIPRVKDYDLKRAASENKKVAIIVADDIADSIIPEMNVYIENLNNDNYEVFSYTSSQVHPETLRAFLSELHSNLDIEGVLFVGNITPAWFQLEDDFGTNGYREWPIDYFYMELNGTWMDSADFSSGSPVAGTDGIYDSHEGDQMPEIYVARMMPTGMSDYIGALRNYFIKNNAHRKDLVNVNKRALVFVDDDWIYWAPSWASDVALLYADYTLIDHPESTRVNNYERNLGAVYEWVSVFVHSWPGGHVFSYDGNTKTEYMYADRYLSLVPPTLFYNFFCCSYARYTENNYGAGIAVFADSFSIASVGSSKSGSMLDFEYFYDPLSKGKSLGESFMDWFAYEAGGGFTLNEFSWHGGMTVMGDPFIYPSKDYLTGIKEKPKHLSQENENNSGMLNFKNVFFSREEMKAEIEKSGCKLYSLKGEILREAETSGIYYIVGKSENKKDIRKVILLR